MTASLTIVPLLGVPEVSEGDDVAALLLAALGPGGLAAGDVVVVSSKVVSKALGLRAAGSVGRVEVVLSESRRVVAERASGDQVTRVVESLAGPVMAAAGVDASNTGPSGALLLLPHDPDACARDLRSSLLSQAGMPSGAPVAVVLSDTAGRPWRAGLTDFALGSAGLRVLLDHRGEADVDGRVLAVTARAVADEIASAADLVKGKTDGVAAAVVRGLPRSWFEVLDDGCGSGAGDVVRVGAGDWFAMGHVEALRAVLGVDPGSADSEAVGIRSVAPEGMSERIARVVALTLWADEDAGLDLELVDGSHHAAVAVLTLGASDAFRLGRLTQRLEVAAASEDLATVGWGKPTAEHSITVTLTARPVGESPVTARGSTP
ncbi:coenzyme F420-0:L-glutamate ligase [Knoellia sp. CPCC 206435]|uniref:coenzyme F420-0:L-glutamate ligase n=1 Tax=Knoellia terrae TaxID=3404797 RepID=UPI003B432984